MAMAEAERARSELSTAKAREEKMANEMARLAIELEESRQVSSGKHSSIAQRTAIEQHSNIAQHSNRTAHSHRTAQQGSHTPSLCPPKTVGEAHA